MLPGSVLAWLLVQVPEPRPAGSEAIEWHAPPGCPDRAALLRGISGRLGRSLLPGEVTAKARIRVHGAGPRYRLTLRLRARGRSQIRRLMAETCAPLADATALLVALAAAGEVATAMPAGVEPSTAETGDGELPEAAARESMVVPGSAGAPVRPGAAAVQPGPAGAGAQGAAENGAVVPAEGRADGREGVGAPIGQRRDAVGGAAGVGGGAFAPAGQRPGEGGGAFAPAGQPPGSRAGDFAPAGQPPGSRAGDFAPAGQPAADSVGDFAPTGPRPGDFAPAGQRAADGVGDFAPTGPRTGDGVGRSAPTGPRATDGLGGDALEELPGDPLAGPGESGAAAGSRRRRPGGVVRVQGGPELGGVPGVTGAIGLAAGLLWWRARIELAGVYLAPRMLERAGGQLRVSLAAASVQGCARFGRGRVEFPVCGGLELGLMRGSARGYLAAREAAGPWLAAVVGGGAAVRLDRRWSLWGAVQGLATIVAPGFELHGPPEAVELFAPAPVSGRLLLGVEVRIADPR